MIPSMFDQLHVFVREDAPTGESAPETVSAQSNEREDVSVATIKSKLAKNRLADPLNWRDERIIAVISGNVTVSVLEKRFALSRRPITEALDRLTTDGRLVTWRDGKTRWWNLSNSEIKKRKGEKE